MYNAAIAATKISAKRVISQTLLEIFQSNTFTTEIACD